MVALWEQWRQQPSPGYFAWQAGLSGGGGQTGRMQPEQGKVGIPVGKPITFKSAKVKGIPRSWSGLNGTKETFNRG